MRLDARAFGIAAATIAALVFTICSIAITMAPEAATTLGGTLVHLDMTGVTRAITWTTFFRGLIAWTFATGLVFASLAGLYNMLVAEESPVPRANAVHRTT